MSGALFPQVKCVVETRDAEHTQQLEQALRANYDQLNWGPRKFEGQQQNCQRLLYPSKMLEFSIQQCILLCMQDHVDKDIFIMRQIVPVSTLCTYALEIHSRRTLCTCALEIHSRRGSLYKMLMYRSSNIQPSFSFLLTPMLGLFTTKRFKLIVQINKFIGKLIFNVNIQ